ncbi:cytochrome d ubiquinol oxidase subunit II [Vibrio cholerae]|nr:cytochrome d ubiquinol oxidase subunit II [Vibrio cholerae]
MFDYETLRLLTWAIVGVLLIGFIITDGFDVGVAALLPILGRSDVQRRVMINSIAPHWDGNQVWLIAAGGAIFAVWPLVYATAFSSFYLAMMLLLAALWLRPIGMDYRSKIDNPSWRKACDNALFISGVVPPLIFGIGFGNLLVGVPFQLNNLLMLDYQGHLGDLFTPFPLLCGLLSLAMVVTQGATFLQLKTCDDLRERSRRVSIVGASMALALFLLGGLLASNMAGYSILSPVTMDEASNPLQKEVVVVAHYLLHNYQEHMSLWLIPCSGLISLLASIWVNSKGEPGWGFLFSSLAIMCIVLTAAMALFPMVMPSSLVPSHSLTIWDATSSQKTLNIITIVAIFVIPVILSYTIWSYYKMLGRLDNEYIHNHSSSLY